MKKILTTTGLCVSLFMGAQAQEVGDGLLFSRTNPGYTAITLGNGGVGSSLGGDVMAVTTNPAGLGGFTRSAFVFSPGLSFTGTKATLQSSNTTDRNLATRDNRASFYLGNSGFIFAGEPIGSRVKNFAFGLTYTRVADFNQTITYDGVSDGSLVAQFTRDANAENVDPANLNPFTTRLAYDTYLIDRLPDNSYVGAMTASNYSNKREVIERSGGIEEFNFSFGANYDDKLLFGAAVGVNFLNYDEKRRYEEIEPEGTINFKSLNFDRFREVNGVGVNFRAGLAYKFNKLFSVGAAVHSPSFYFANEKYSTGLGGVIEYNGNTENNYYNSEVVGEYEQNFRTPWRFSGSMTYIIPRRGFIGAEIEYQDYGTAAYSATSGANFDDRRFLDEVSNNIDARYKGNVALRVGGEIGDRNLRVRAGYSLRTSPYEAEASGISDLQHTISGGLSFHSENVFFALSYAHQLSEFAELPYASSGVAQRVDVKQNRGLAMATIGFRWN